MPATGFVLPAARTVDAGNGTWTNDVNILADDGAEATFSLAVKNTTGRALRGQTFGFDSAVPVGATIDAVEIRMEYRVNSTGGIANPELQAFVGGAAVGAVRVASPLEPTTLTVNTFDITADRAWTRADLLDGTFEVRTWGRNGNSATDPSYRWDYIAAQVTYSTPGNTGTVAVTQDDQTSTVTGVLGYTGTAAINVLPVDDVDSGSTATPPTDIIDAGNTSTPPVDVYDAGEGQGWQWSTATGTVAAPAGPVTGTVAVTQTDQTSTATGVLGYSGTSTQTQADQTSTASGTVTGPATTVVREFDGIDDRIRWTAGGLTGMTHGTVAALFKMVDTAGSKTLFAGVTSGGAYLFTPSQFDFTEQHVWHNGTGGVSWAATVPTAEWVLIVSRKATGTTTPRRSLYRYSNDTWTHANAGGSLANWVALGGTSLIAMATDLGSSEVFNGRVAAMAAWSNTLPWSADTTGDTALEAAGLEDALQNWANQSPTALWAFNQASVATPVDDLSATGTADQSAITGTAVISNETLAFDYTLTGGAITGTVAVTQDNQTSTATGVLGYSGTSSQTQADQTATATGVLGYSGASSQTQDDQTATASGTSAAPGNSGTVAATQDDQTSTAAGVLGYTGSSSQTQADQTATASGTSFAPGTSGTVAAIQDDQTSTASGVLGYTGLSAQTQADQTATASGWITVTGTAAAIQADQTSTASGTVAGAVPPPTIPLAVQDPSHAVEVSDPLHAVLATDLPTALAITTNGQHSAAVTDVAKSVTVQDNDHSLMVSTPE